MDFLHELVKWKIKQGGTDKKCCKFSLIQIIILAIHSLFLALYISMIVIGVVYQDKCNNDATSYLLIAGSCGFGFQLYKLITIFTPMATQNKIVIVLTSLASIIMIGLATWGSIQVFSIFTTWQEQMRNEEKDKDGYCDYIAYVFTFIVLVVEWLIKPIIWLSELWHIFYYIGLDIYAAKIKQT